MDGYISSPDGSLDWLDCVPNPEGSDLGFFSFMERVDAVLMGRLTFETVAGFGMGWTYPKPGLILSSTMTAIPEPFQEQVQLVNGSPQSVLARAQALGYHNLYVDGGKTIQSFLKEDLIDEMIITEIPILLGGACGYVSF